VTNAHKNKATKEKTQESKKERKNQGSLYLLPFIVCNKKHKESHSPQDRSSACLLESNGCVVEERVDLLLEGLLDLPALQLPRLGEQSRHGGCIRLPGLVTEEQLAR
jgi:hypothetical protein